jgi:hypothetical protein
MKRPGKSPVRRQLGQVSTATKGPGGPDIEMVGLWHKPGLTH